MSDAGQGCVYTIVIGLVLLVLAVVASGFVLEKLADVQRAEAAVQEQQTIQQKDYYTFMAAMAAMGRQVTAPWWIYALALFDVGLIGVLIVTWKRQR